MESWSRTQSSSSYADLHQRSQESYCSSSSGSTGLSERAWKRRPNRSNTKSGGSVGMDKDKYIEFLEREVFKKDKARLKEKEREKSSSESESVLHSKMDSLIEVQEEQSSRMKLELDKTLALQEQRILENEKKLQTLASLVKTTQIFAEGQEEMMKQALETSMNGVNERLKSIESSAASESNSCKRGGVEEEEEEISPSQESANSLSMLKSAKEEIRKMEERLQKDHQKQLTALNRKWEERTKAIEKRISEDYKEKLKQLEIKVASKLEKVLLKVNATGKGTKTTKKTKGTLKKKKTVKSDEHADADAGDFQEERRLSGGLDEGRKMQALEKTSSALTKYELASSLKDITRHMVEKILADREGQKTDPFVPRPPSEENSHVPSNATENENPTDFEFPSQETKRVGTKGPLPPKPVSSVAVLKSSNLMNQKRSKTSASSADARKAPAKAETNAKSRKQKKAKGKNSRKVFHLERLPKQEFFSLFRDN